MSLLSKGTQRKSLVVFSAMYPSEIYQEYEEPARLLLNGHYVFASCMGCSDQPCMRFSEHDVSCPEFSNFSYERNYSVCPVNAIHWNYEDETPEIDNTACIGCGLCASRCSVGAIYFTDKGLNVYKIRNEQFMTQITYNPEGVEKQQNQLKIVKSIFWQHRFRKESELALASIYQSLSHVDGRSMIPNLLVRNILICLGYNCAISRMGDVYTRMDAVYSGSINNKTALGVIEVEFGRDTLDASRSILDDIAVLHSRSHINADDNSALVVCLAFPNKRQGYFQVIKDIKNVLGLEIQTVSIGALLIFIWNSMSIDFSQKEFYVDFDSMSIRLVVEHKLGRKIQLPHGYLGVLEPEK